MTSMTTHNMNPDADLDDRSRAVDEQRSAGLRDRAAMFATWRAEIENHASAMNAEAAEILERLAALNVTTIEADTPPPTLHECAVATPCEDTVENRCDSADGPSRSSADTDPETDRFAALKSRLQQQLAGAGQTMPACAEEQPVAINEGGHRS